MSNADNTETTLVLKPGLSVEKTTWDWMLKETLELIDGLYSIGYKGTIESNCIYEEREWKTKPQLEKGHLGEVFAFMVTHGYLPLVFDSPEGASNKKYRLKRNR